MKLRIEANAGVNCRVFARLRAPGPRLGRSARNWPEGDMTAEEAAVRAEPAAQGEEPSLRIQRRHEAVERLHGTLLAHAVLDAFQDRQFELWQDLRGQGNPWRITDFVTVGAPMALADLLVTGPGIVSGFKKSDLMDRRELFDGLVRRGALVRCPPRSETLPVEGDEHGRVSYRWRECGAREVLGSLSPFVVTRWTNLWFPVIRGGLHGDWFGGELRSLFGPGIRDIEVRGNQPERFKRGSAHTEYFSHPDKGDQGDVAWHLRRTLALQTSNPARTEGGPCSALVTAKQHY
jgi:hypothetical protein